MDTNDKLLAIACHASLFVALGVIFPLIILVLVKKSAFVTHHAKQALVSQGLFYIGYSIAALLCVILIGFVILPVLFVIQLIFTIIAIIKTLDNDYYAYPVTGQLAEKL
ncbi:MAG: DUF4870 domain-containing protein [Desulfotomaculum sp.]|nr:DUF4870 domain-containing protein [Desulfotomaculum sp.]MCL0081111.1 DUF4870 domain-containing protein [Peptococcaceae bacterium]